MKKLVIPLALLLCAVAPLFAQSDTKVLISDVLYLQSTTPWTGVINIAWPRFRAAGGTEVSAGNQDFPVTNGVIAISLYSTVGASPSFRYTATFRTTDGPNRGLKWTEAWTVGATGPVPLGGPTGVRQVSGLTTGIGFTYRGVYSGRPTSPSINDLALFTNAASAGECPPTGGTERAACVWNGTAWVAFAGTGSGGGGSSGGINGTSTWAEIEAGTAPSGTVTGTMTWAQIEAGG